MSCCRVPLIMCLTKRLVTPPGVSLATVPGGEVGIVLIGGGGGILSTTGAWSSFRLINFLESQCLIFLRWFQRLKIKSMSTMTADRIVAIAATKMIRLVMTQWQGSEN